LGERLSDVNLRSFEIDVSPGQREGFTYSHPGVGQNVNERGESPIDSGVVFARLACGFEYGAKLVRRENVWAFDFGTVGH